MILTKKASVFATLLLTNLIHNVVDAHGYLKTPRSRNYHASLVGKDWGGGSNDPAAEYCPHCLNLGGTLARCGLIGDHNYDRPPSAAGGVLPNIIQASYSAESTIEFESILTAHHWGHITLKVCPISPGQIAYQSCFDANPLKFVSDPLYGAWADPNYPERAYIPGPSETQKTSEGHHRFLHRFQLPSGVGGDLGLIQWHYTTANSCKPLGYNSYGWPKANPGSNLGTCTSIPPDGNGIPEQFWNCAEVSIEGKENPTSPKAATPTTPTTLITTTATTTAPTTPTMPPTPSGGTCGSGNVGDGICANRECCSEWGWCGTSSDHCNRSNPTPPPPDPTPPTSITMPTSHSSCNGCSWDGGNSCDDWWCNESQSNCDVCTGTWYGKGLCGGCSWDGGNSCPDLWCNESQLNCNVCTGTWYGGGSSGVSLGTCGGGNQGDGVCADGTCCSQYGWCGTSSAHCSGRKLRGNATSEDDS
mmetsp:Transcript_18369/g.38545  ORF Transcript_18369/g.38545 Transcript_18369/m.38545 type:complete len:474 (+) Transcript_18369:162-1583(+)